MKQTDKDAFDVLKRFKKERSTNGGFERNFQKLTVVDGGKGWLVCEFPVEDEDKNSHGTLHGGFMSAVVDSVSSWALMLVDGGRQHASTSIHITYLKPARMGSTVIVKAKVENVGLRMAFMTVELLDKDSGKMLAHATHRKMMLEKGSKL